MDLPNYQDFEMVDNRGNRIGPVTGLWVNEANNEPEFASVKTGWIFGREHVVPMRECQIDEGKHRITAPYDEALIKEAPHYPVDATLDPSEAGRIYSHYEVEPLRAEGTFAPGGTRLGERRLEGREPETAEIPLHEERMAVGKETVETGAVRLRKVVRSEPVKEPVELQRERIEIERIPATEATGRRKMRAKKPFEQDEIVLRERDERPVVGKTSEITGAVQAEKRLESRREDVKGTLRKEDVEIDRDENVAETTDRDADRTF